MTEALRAAVAAIPFPTTETILSRAEAAGWSVETDERVPNQVLLIRVHTGETVLLTLDTSGLVIAARWFLSSSKPLGSLSLLNTLTRPVS